MIGVGKVWSGSSQRLKPTYTPEEAAEFLGITVHQVAALTRNRYLTLRRFNKRDYYLGGELDCVKINLHERLKKV